MLDENIKYLIELNASLNNRFVIDDSLGEMHCPTLNELRSDFSFYSYFTSKFLDLYEDNKDEFYKNITHDNKVTQEFCILISYYKENKNVYFDKGSFYVLNYKAKESEKDIDEESIKINLINESNVDIFMGAISVLNWRSKGSKEYKPANKIAEEMMKRADELKKKLKKNKDNKKGIGMLEIISSVCARHPSLNLINIKELNYYQIIDQFHRLQMLDDYGMSANALSSGSLSEEGVKKMSEKHYTDEIKLNN